METARQCRSCDCPGALRKLSVTREVDWGVQKTRSDILGVLRLNAERLDRQLMRERAREVGVQDLLEHAIEAATTQ